MNPSVHNSKSISEKSVLLKWTFIMSESAPLKDNVHNLQKGHNGEHLIWWSLMKLHHQHLMDSTIQSELSGLNEKLQNPSRGRYLCRFTQKPNKTPAAHCIKGLENRFNDCSNGKSLHANFKVPQISAHNEKCVHGLTNTYRSHWSIIETPYNINC